MICWTRVLGWTLLVLGGGIIWTILAMSVANGDTGREVLKAYGRAGLGVLALAVVAYIFSLILALAVGPC